MRRRHSWPKLKDNATAARLSSSTTTPRGPEQGHGPGFVGAGAEGHLLGFRATPGRALRRPVCVLDHEHLLEADHGLHAEIARHRAISLWGALSVLIHAHWNDPARLTSPDPLVLRPTSAVVAQRPRAARARRRCRYRDSVARRGALLDPALERGQRGPGGVEHAA